MAKNDAENIERMLVTEDMKERWKLVPQEYYPLFMVEQDRLIIKKLDNMNRKINSI